MLSLLSLTSATGPMHFPYPFENYASDSLDPGKYFIPVYKHFDFLKNSLPWTYYFGLGCSKTILNTLWIDLCVLAIQLIYF